MNLLRRFPKLCFALVLLSIVGFCVAQGSVGLLLVAGILAALSWYVTEGPRGLALPRWVSNLLTVAVTLNVFVDFVQNLDDVMGVLGRFTIWLTLIKLYEQKKARDYAQLLALSLLLMLTGCLQSTDLLFGLVLVAYAVLGLYVLIQYQFYAAHERSRFSRQERVPAGSPWIPSIRPIIGRRVALHVGALIVFITALGFVFSSMVFIAMPRDLGHAFFSQFQGRASNQRSGYTDEINLAGGGRITESRRTIMDVQLLDDAGRSFRSSQPLYLRGAALDRYDVQTGRWSESRSRRAQVERLNVMPNRPEYLGDDPPTPALTNQLVINDRTGSDRLFSVATPVRVETPTAEQIIFNAETQTMAASSDGSIPSYAVWYQPAPSEETLRSIVGRPPGGLDPRNSYSVHNSTLIGLDDQPLTILSNSIERVRTFAHDMLREAGIPQQRPISDERWEWDRQVVRLFHDYLQNSGEFFYTLDLSDVEATGDPVAQFLFDFKRGHCEFFASALAALCHSVGVQARVISGYVLAEYDESTASYVVRESNAHAWVEARIGPYQWMTVDATPPDTLLALHRPERSFGDRLRWLYDKLEFQWTNNVVSFNRSSQRRLSSQLDLDFGDRVNAAWERLRYWAVSVNRFFALGPAGYIWLGSLALVAIIAVAAVVTVARRRRRIRQSLHMDHLAGRDSKHLLRQLGFYLDALDVLDRHGLSKPIWQPPLRFAGVLAGDHPQASVTLREIADVLYASRYGGRPLDREQRERAQQLVHRLERELQAE